jgi:hypothetical protein
MSFNSSLVYGRMAQCGFIKKGYPKRVCDLGIRSLYLMMSCSIIREDDSRDNCSFGSRVRLLLSTILRKRTHWFTMESRHGLISILRELLYPLLGCLEESVELRYKLRIHKKRLWFVGCLFLF